MSLDPKTKDYEILKKTIYAEARGEPIEGQKAVAWVAKNRAEQNKKHFGGSTLEGVCKKEKQFSCWNGRSDIQMTDRKASDAIDKWLPTVFQGNDPTHGADHYFNPSLASPSWKDKCEKTETIGNHEFYKCPK